MGDGHALWHVKLGHRSVIAIIIGILLKRCVVHQDSQRVGRIVDRLRPGVSDGEPIPIGKTALRVQLQRIIVGIRGPLHDAHIVESGVDSKLWVVEVPFMPARIFWYVGALACSCA